VADHGLLDRLIRGRLWIAIVGFALIGIVAMQLVVLRLNTEVGKGLERKANLQREISTLQVTGSALTAAARIQAEAGRRGMQLGASGVAAFLTAQGSDAGNAAALLTGSAARQQSAEGHAAEGHAAEAQASEAQPSEAHSSEAQSSQAHASEAQSSESHASEPQSSEAQSSQAQSGETQSGSGGTAGQEAPHG
jgi:hypothetical protein